MRRRPVSTVFIRLIFFLLGFSLISAGGSSEDEKAIDKCVLAQEMKKLTLQIEELEDLRLRYLARTLYHQDQSIRIQFQKKQLLLAKQHGILGKGYQEIVDKIQGELVLIKARRQEVCRRYCRQ